MRKLVIPDIHQKHLLAQNIINTVDHDRVVFLGDYWDDWYDSPRQAAETAAWLNKRLEEHPEDEFILGNHDLYYLWGNAKVACSGNTLDKRQAILQNLDVLKWRSRFKLHIWEGDILLSHAGLTEHYTSRSPKNLKNYLGKEANTCLDSLNKGNHTPYLIQAGQDRGGYMEWGGIVWCDYSKFRPTKGVRQIFGHTPNAFVRNNGENYCIDTSLKHAAVIEDGLIKVHEVRSGGKTIGGVDI